MSSDYRAFHSRACPARLPVVSVDRCSCGGLQQPLWEPGDEPKVNKEPVYETAMCECGHHWNVHAASGLTAPDAVCHGYTGSTTPGPLRQPCACRGFAPWSGPRDARTGEPVRPLTVTVDARQPVNKEPAAEIVSPGSGLATWTAVRHNHLTRDIKPYGQCPGCDRHNPVPANLDVTREENTPDWVICGVEDVYGCAVLASSALTRAQLLRKLDGYRRGWNNGRYPIIKNNLILEFEEFTMIRGETYAACMQTLAERWSPPEPGGSHGDTSADPDVAGHELPPS